jgi:hypothetical protein
MAASRFKTRHPETQMPVLNIKLSFLLAAKLVAITLAISLMAIGKHCSIDITRSALLHFSDCVFSYF